MLTKHQPTDKQTLLPTSYLVFYGDHDSGAQPGMMLRHGLENAERTAKLMEECGYRFTDIQHALTVGKLDK